MDDRYRGKPLLRLLELYVLWAIECISPNDLKKLVEMTPKLQKTYGHSGLEWHEIIAKEMNFHKKLSEELRNIWIKNSKLAFANKEILQPEDFAKMIVDANFSK